jgi:hypothetical protein
MSKRGIAVLAVVAVALLGYILIFERASVTSKERGERAGRVLVSFVRDKVERLTIQRKGTQVVLVRKREDDGSFTGFRVLEPFAAKADDDAVDQVLGELEWLSARRTLTALSDADEKRFGLDAPRYRVGFSAGREAHTLAVGHDDVHGDGLYVLLDDERTAYVVPKTLLEALDHEAGHFRDKQLFPELTVAWAHKLAIVHETRQASFVKEGGRWWIAGEPKLYAAAQRIDEVLHALSELRAAHFLDARQRSQAEAALRTPRGRVEVAVVPDETREDKRPKQLTLTMAGPCVDAPTEHYARVEVTGADALLVCVSEASLAPFALGSEPLQEPRLFQVDTSEVQSFVLARAKDKLALSRDGERWKAQGETAGEINRESVEAWLTDLAAARASRFGPLEGYEEQGSLTLELGHDKRERIGWGALDAQGELPIRRGEEPQLARFAGSLFDRLQPTRGRFASLEVWAARQPSEVVRVDAAASGRRRVSRLEGGQWSAGDAGATLDGERTRELVRGLIDLRARSFVSDAARPLHGLGPAQPHVTLTLQQGGPLTLELGATTDRGAYARIDGQSVVEVGSEVIAIVQELSGGPRAPDEPSELIDTGDEEDELEHEHAH